MGVIIYILLLGLSEDMLKELSKDEDLLCLIKLHDSVQKVKNNNNENSTKIKELRELFTDLRDKIQTVFKE